jgi:hypothetical protein
MLCPEFPTFNKKPSPLLAWNGVGACVTLEIDTSDELVVAQISRPRAVCSLGCDGEIRRIGSLEPGRPPGKATYFCGLPSIGFGTHLHPLQVSPP